MKVDDPEERTLATIDDLAARLRGRIPTRIDRVVYDFEGELEACSDLQLWCDGELVRLFVGRDVEVISWDTTPWRDPFEHASEDNAEYLRTHGRFRIVDVTSANYYCDLVGRPILRVLPLTNRFGKLGGVTLESERVAANVHIVGDDLSVTWGDDIPHW